MAITLLLADFQTLQWPSVWLVSKSDLYCMSFKNRRTWHFATLFFQVLSIATNFFDSNNKKPEFYKVEGFKKIWTVWFLEKLPLRFILTLFWVWVQRKNQSIPNAIIFPLTKETIEIRSAIWWLSPMPTTKHNIISQDQFKTNTERYCFAFCTLRTYGIL